MERGFTSLPEAVERHGARHADAPAIIDGDDVMTWGRLRDAMNGIAAGLPRHGVARGTPVVMIAGNSTWAYAAMFGILRAGGVFTPLSPMLTPAMIARFIMDSGARVVMIDEALAAIIAAVRAALTTPNVTFISSASPEWRALVAAPPTASEPLAPNDRFNIIYSSGTTGTPKGIVHTHGARVAMGEDIAQAMRFGPACRSIVATPPFSNGTFIPLLPTTLAGGVLVLMRKYNPADLRDLVARHRPTHAFLVPTMLQGLADQPDFAASDWSSFDAVISAGAPMPAHLKQTLLARHDFPLYELWGVTEGLASVIATDDIHSRPASVGRALPRVELRVIEDDATGAGEIVGRSPYLMSEYLGRGLPADCVWCSPDGRIFFRTGDIGTLDAQGFLMLLGRKKDMIVSGGLNVYPTDIEAVLLQHPCIADAAVMAMPDAKWGEVPVACVIAKPAATNAANDLQAWANSRLAKHQRIAALKILAEFPRNALGKVLKAELKRAAWGPQ